MEILDNKTSTTNDLFLKYSADDLSLHVLRSVKDPDVSAFSHNHSENEFLIPNTSVPFLVINQVLYHGDHGEVYYIPSYVEHGSEYLDKASFLSVVISKDFFEEMKTRLGCDHDLVLPTEFPSTQVLNNLLSLFKEEVLAIHPSRECLHYLSTLITMELILSALGERGNLKTQEMYQRLKKIKETADFMMANFQRDIKISDAAALGAMNLFHYIRTFKKYFGEPPYQYLVNIRICISKLLLENTDLAIKEISSKAGFLSPNRFSKSFKGKMKITPTEYRCQYQVIKQLESKNAV